MSDFSAKVSCVVAQPTFCRRMYKGNLVNIAHGSSPTSYVFAVAALKLKWGWLEYFCRRMYKGNLVNIAHGSSPTSYVFAVAALKLKWGWLEYEQYEHLLWQHSFQTSPSFDIHQHKFKKKTVHIIIYYVQQQLIRWCPSCCFQTCWSLTGRMAAPWREILPRPMPLSAFLVFSENNQIHPENVMFCVAFYWLQKVSYLPSSKGEKHARHTSSLLLDIISIRLSCIWFIII